MGKTAGGGAISSGVSRTANGSRSGGRAVSVAALSAGRRYSVADRNLYQWNQIVEAITNLGRESVILVRPNRVSLERKAARSGLSRQEKTRLRMLRDLERFALAQPNLR